MRIRAFGASDVGKRREKNEDSFLINEDHNLYIVADGMGGHLGGDIASRLATATIDETIRALEVDPEMTIQEVGPSIKSGEYQSYLRYAIRLASQRIFEKACNEMSLHGMGTTTVAALIKNNKAYIANVGDSRVYRVRGEKIDQITKDHSLVGEQVRAGILSEDDARAHRFKNIITKSVGFQEDVDADIDIRVLRQGDKFVLCTDGLTNMVKANELRDIVSTNDPETATRRLVDVANERGGDDNITVVIFEAVELDRPVYENTDDDSTIEL